MDRRVILRNNFFRITLIIAFLSIASQDVKAQAQKGKAEISIRDSISQEAVPFASIYDVESGQGIVADVNGRFSIAYKDKARLRISCLGYATKEITINTRATHRITLCQQSVALKDFTVTARYNDRLGSEATIGQEALEFIQPTSIQDIFQLLPGGKIGANNMQNRQMISSRQVGTDASTSFGMGFSVDGVPVQNDAMRIQMSGLTGNGTNAVGEGNVAANIGVDTRTISTNHIENIIVNRGIASAKEGNISSGTIKITPKHGKSPLQVRAKFDPLNKLAYIGKGFLLSKELGTLYLGADIVKSANDISDSRGEYNRITAQANWNNQWNIFGKQVDMTLRGSYVTSFNDNKTDDVIKVYHEKYKTKYEQAMLSLKLNAKLNWLLSDELEFIASGEYTNNILKHNKHVTLQTVTPLQRSQTEGEGEGIYLPQQYDTYYEIENKPVNMFAELTSSKFGTIGKKWNYSYMLGTSFNASKNIGDGAVFDAERPPFPSNDFIHPRRNKDIPALMNHAGYIETKFRYSDRHSEWNIQTGLRETMLLNLPKSYALRGRMLIEPRLQTSYTLTTGKVKNTLRIGYGEEAKMPSADYLYPDKVYHDFIALNAYFTDASKRLLITNTKIQDPTNRNIRENRNKKIEMGWDFHYDDCTLSLPAFHEKMNGGIEYFTQFSPTSYTYYYELKHNVDTKPTREDFYSKERNVFMQMSIPTNSSKVIKKGLEYRVHLPNIEALKTDVEINGAWYKTKYANGVPTMYYPAIMTADEPYPYVGLYDGFDALKAENFNTNFWINTHLPNWKLIFTNFIQIVWFERQKLLSEIDEYPERYMDTNGDIHTLTKEDIATNSVFSSLQRDINSARYNEMKEPVSLRWNLKMTKEINNWVKLSFFADNIIQINNKYKDNYMHSRRNWHKPFFGAELTFKL